MTKQSYQTFENKVPEEEEQVVVNLLNSNSENVKDSSSSENNFFIVAILIAVVIGFLTGIILNSVTNLGEIGIEIIAFPGEILIRCLKAAVLPLIITSIMSGVFNIASQSEDTAKRTIFGAISYLFIGSLLAVCVSIFLSLTIAPGKQVVLKNDSNNYNIDIDNINIESVMLLSRNKYETNNNNDNSNSTVVTALLDLGRDMFPDNLVQAAADFNVLGMITWSILSAALLIKLPEEVASPVLNFIKSLYGLTMEIINLFMYLVPFGIASLIASRILKDGDLNSMIGLLWFMCTVLFGLFIQMFLILPTIYFLGLKKNPYKALWHCREALVTAFGTDSSSATLPVTLKVAESMNIDKSIAESILPAFSTLNMQGTALYEAAAAIFIAQTLDIHFTLAQLFVVALTASLASIGAAGTPEAGIWTMIIVFESVGLPLESIGLLLSIDWLLDRVRTMVNVAGDLVGCAVINKMALKDVKHSPSTDDRQ